MLNHVNVAIEFSQIFLFSKKKKKKNRNVFLIEGIGFKFLCIWWQTFISHAAIARLSDFNFQMLIIPPKEK